MKGYFSAFLFFPVLASGQDIAAKADQLLTAYSGTDVRLLSRDLAAVAFGEQYALPVKKQEVKLSGEILSKYAGKYQMQNGFSVEVTHEGEKLFAQAQGDPTKMELTPESESKFFLKGPETAVEFLQENNEVKYMFVDIQGGQKLSRVVK